MSGEKSFDRGGRGRCGEELLTAKDAKKSRKERKEKRVAGTELRVARNQGGAQRIDAESASKGL